ncbi:ATP-binding protein [Bdellovibrionota bacterium FG-2]
MTIKIAAPLTTEATPCLQWIEVASFFQIPQFVIIGLPAPEVMEARERVRAAISSSGFKFPKRRVVLNLSPSSIKKRGTGIDLAMALSVLANQAKIKSPYSIAAWGELGLDGTLKASGQITRAVVATLREEIPYLLVQKSEAATAIATLASLGSLAPPTSLQIIGVENLAEAWLMSQRIFEGKIPTIQPPTAATLPAAHPKQTTHKLLPLPPTLARLVSASISGAHHLLLLGPKGVGKSQAIEWMTALLPEPSAHSRIEQLLLKELSSEPNNNPYIMPIRRVSSLVRPAALIGNATASTLHPGECSLAHGGILIADELPEWARDSREALREPLERRRVTLSRVSGAAELPAEFILAATGNLCPCGGVPKNFPRAINAGKGVESSCDCTQARRKAYFSRISGPLLDRIDIAALVGLQAPALTSNSEYSFEKKQSEIHFCREILQRTLGKLPGNLDPRETEDLLQSQKEWLATLEQLQFKSLRARHKCFRLALTLAALDKVESGPTQAHFFEAANYRPERLGFC